MPTNHKIETSGLSPKAKEQIQEMLDTMGNSVFITRPLLSRINCQPSKNTFSMKPAYALAKRWIGNPHDWIDPFARDCQLVYWTNDLNPETDAKEHLDFRDFFDSVIESKITVEGVILDPPFSPDQIKRSYEGIGYDFTQEDSHGLYNHAWDKILEIMPMYVIMAGWHTNGRKEHYELEEVMILAHGSQHYDTLISVWRKKDQQLDQWFG